MLAFVVGVVVGAQNANDQVSAATGTIHALNVGTCVTTKADVFLLSNCSQKDAFYQQDELEDLIEVDTLYATYSHDPATAAEAPRAILQDGDLVRVSVTDKGRDRRDPVVIATGMETLADNTSGYRSGVTFTFDDPDDDPDAGATIHAYIDEELDDTATPPTQALDSRALVAEEAGFDASGDLPEPEQQVQFDQPTGGATGDTTFEQSGTYEIIWEREDGETDEFKPIAKDGVVKFFGRVNDGLGATAGGDDIEGYGPFRDLSAFITLDEDVISGEPDEPPVMTLNVSVPDPAGATGEAVQIQLIYYQTSGIEFIQGGDTTAVCTENPHLDDDPRIQAQAACTSDEIKDGATYSLYAASDEDAGDAIRNLALVETGRFTGVFQGLVRLTDADGDGGDPRINWGRMKGDGSYNHAPAADSTDANPTEAVIGVGNGPVTIHYKDTDGQNREYQIEIDITAPTISIDSPAHNARSDDEKPSFIGTFNDSDSGLAADSFQLDVDNTDDREDPQFVINIAADVSVEGEAARRRQDYLGFANGDGLYGVITVGGDIYKMEDVPANDDTAPVHFSLEADDFDDGAPDGEFNGEIEVNFDEFIDNDDFDGFNNAVDFQALVRDLAGNVGFSDSDPAGPRFINDLGEKETDRKTPNVIGVFSAHIVHIDEIDPYVMTDSSVTGFYGLNDDDIPVRDRSAVMVVFDSSVNGDLIDTGTFQLQKGEADAIEVVDVKVDGKLVFLKLGEELASDATPTLSITEGREVEDLAGNLLTWQEPIDGQDGGDKEIEVNDGILPVFTVTLSGGSGTGVGSESPSRLTENAMDIDIESDEDINGSPTVSVVCNNIQWTEDDTTKKLSNYVGIRTGYSEGDNTGDTLSCGAPPDEGSPMPNDFPRNASLARPGNNWVYAWRNAAPAQLARHLNDGKLTVVVWARDRSTYDEHKDNFCRKDDNPDTVGECQNWGSQTVEFTLDDTFNSPLKADGSGGSVQPEAETEVKENRPFIYLDFAGEGTSVTVTEFQVDGEDVLADLDSVGDNRFLYWPESLVFGTHKVSFDARDAANNEPDGNTSFEFDVTARDPFVIDLTAGWNAISFPANPVDTALGAVFTEEAVDRVVGWNPLSSNGPWSIATRVDGVWETSANFAPLTDVVVRYGYWVHSAAFVEQSVDLQGQINRETGDAPAAIGIITVPGWNFVGVVDQDGDQTEDNFGDTLQDSEDADVTADDYMPGYTRAYTWDAIANGYRILDGDAGMEIGQGIWVFFPDDNTIAP